MIIFKPAWWSRLPVPALHRARWSFHSESKLRTEGAGVLRGKHTGHQIAAAAQIHTPKKLFSTSHSKRDTPVGDSREGWMGFAAAWGSGRFPSCPWQG